MGNSVDELNRKYREEYEASKGMTTGSMGGNAAEVHVVEPEPEPEPTPEPEPEPEEAA